MSDIGNMYQATNYQRLLTNNKFVITLGRSIERKLGRHLSKQEMGVAIEILKGLNPRIFQHKPIDYVLKVLTEQISETLATKPCATTEDDVDIKEMLKNQIGITTEDDTSNIVDTTRDFAEQLKVSVANTVSVESFLGNKTVLDLQRIINPDLVKRACYIIADTRNRLLDNDGTTYFQWNIVNTDTISQGTINLPGNIKDIVSMRIHPIRMPFTSTAQNDYQRVSIFMREFSAQSYIAAENRRFHYMLGTNVGNRWIDLETDRFNDGYFRFRSPVSRLDTLTLTFGSPLENIVFDPDRMQSTVNSYSSPTTFVTTSSHNLETGDLVYISNFSTLNPTTDTVPISLINRSEGHIVSVTNDTTFTIDVDTTDIQELGSGTIAINSGATTVTGTATLFTSFFIVGDYIEIIGVQYEITAITSDLLLTIATPYASSTAAGLSYYRNNINPNLRPSLYFGAKRMFITFEIEYYEKEETTV